MDEGAAPQGSNEWLDERLGCITGSEAWRLFSKGEARKTYLYQIGAEILTSQTHVVRSKSMDHGKSLESEARAEYEMRKNLIVQEVGFIRAADNPRVGCSVDGLVGGEGIIEIKCPYNPAQHVRRIISGADRHEFLQIQFNLYVTERLWCDFASYDPKFPGEARLVIRRYVAESEYQEIIDEAVDKALLDIDAIVDQIMTLAEQNIETDSAEKQDEQVGAQIQQAPGDAEDDQADSGLAL